MWLLVIFFMPIAILLVILDEHIKKQESEKQHKEVSKTIKNLENEYNEINHLVQNLELEENKSRGNEGKDIENVYDDTMSNEEIEQFINSIKDDEFAELTDNEYSLLKTFHKVNKYKELKNNELSFKKGYKKNDILWSIYNMQALEYLNKKDYVMVSVVYDNMHNLLYRERRYEKSLEFLICCLYMRVYEILPSDGIICDTDCYERHLKKYMKELRDILEKNDMDIKKFDNRYKFITEYVKVPIQMYLSHWYEFERINKFQQKINEFLDA